MRTVSVITLIASVFISSVTYGEDWPQWMGQNRDGVWNEKHVVDAIPEGGLPVKWRVPVRHGYSGPAVAKGRVFVMYYDTAGEVSNNPSGISDLTGEERVLCFDAKTGAEIWKHSYPQAYKISVSYTHLTLPTTPYV